MIVSEEDVKEFKEWLKTSGNIERIVAANETNFFESYIEEYYPGGIVGISVDVR